MAYDPQKVVDIALAEVGYLEKKSNKELDDKTANAGSNNYTKYARDLATYLFYNGKKYGVAWCDVFVDWCFVTAYGKDAALAMTYQPTKASSNCGAGCKFSRNYYKNKKQLFDTPRVGDQIFFYNSDKSSIAHTGLVYKVDDKKVYTVEGNTSGASGVIANGGGVCKKSYSLTYTRIAGYGRPNYGTNVGEPVPTPTPTETVTSQQESEVFTMRTLRVNCKGTQVKVLQWLLNNAGCNAGTVDGVFGKKTSAAVKAYQKKVGLEADGVVGSKTWTKLLA